MPTNFGSQRKGRSMSGWRVLLPARRSRSAARRLHGFEPLESRRMLSGAEPSSGFDLAAGEGGDPVPDFSLPDLNPNSETHNQSVSPRDFITQNKVSAYYFGYGL